MSRGNDLEGPGAHGADVPGAPTVRHLEATSLLEATPECLVLAADDGRIMFANRAAEALTGFSRHELEGQTVELLVAVELASGKRGERIETICRRKNGDDLPSRSRSAGPAKTTAWWS